MKLQTISIMLKAEDIPAQRDRIAAYLYGNFALQPAVIDVDGYASVRVTGFDRSGWTAQAQCDRLWSGCIAAKVVTPDDAPQRPQWPLGVTS
jgi:hypothetical protein